jgi:hypothetical protein
MIANLVSGKPIFAAEPATRKSQQSAISMPPPNAAPSIAAMVGMGNV